MNNSKNWRLILDPQQDAFTNMAIDEAIARAVNSTGRTGASPVPTRYRVVPTIRIYGWKPNSVSIGYFQKISAVVNGLELNGTEKHCDIVRRPTGGTAVMHDGGPSFSLVMKDGLCAPSTKMDINGLYEMLGRCIVEAQCRLGISVELWNGPRRIPDNSTLCVSSLCPYDVVSNNRKLAGYAARRLRGTTLLQGYISLTDGLTDEELRDAMIDAIERVAGVKLQHDTLTEEERTLTTRLRDEKYTRREWNYRR